MSEKKSRNLFVVGYVVLMLTLMVMSSCGSSKMYHVGTGQETYKVCGATFIK
jgi:hypothetical protein